MNPSKRVWAVTTTLVSVVVSLAACSGTEGTRDSGGSSGSVRFLIAENFWADWEPYQSTAQSQARLEEQIYDYLIEFPEGDLTNPRPSLATDWEQIDDTTWEFELREGVKFHEGQTLDGDDVKASVERASGATKVTTVTAQNWVPTTVEVVDDNTVRLVTERPFAPLLPQLSDTPIVSDEWLNGPKKQLREVPNGTGPFRVTQDTRTTKSMEANADYWGDRPQIDTLTWEFVQDAQTRLNALISGEAQAIDRVPPEHLSTIENDPDLDLTSVTAIESVNLWVHPGRLALWDNNEEFRQAVNWSIDRGALVENLVQGESVAASSFLPEQTQYQQPQDTEYTFDPAEAKKHLQAAGQPDGGPEFELWVATGFLPRAKEVVETIASNMREVGLNPKIVTSDVAGMIDDIFSENGSGLMYHLSWSSNGDPHQAAQVYGDPFVWNVGDDRMNALIQQGLTTLEPAQREQVYGQLQSYMWELAPHVPLYNSDFTIAYTSDLQGVEVTPDFTTDFYPATLSSSD